MAAPCSVRPPAAVRYAYFPQRVTWLAPVAEN